ncbi:outer membrane efflux protein [Chthoniobacter flavus Ellin428]|uniref:Outer membrane efflux protein n=1 Tax=Chthoniobacter flavus Ellin428 TaxID=497964 RepID=B4D7Y0_9BACT|nr:outer membrane efflux protein [Chthoniobacter flavus Ellin428]TCO92298.1 outer membrane protein TolC [Chthoniobacter flavus]
MPPRSFLPFRLVPVIVCALVAPAGPLRAVPVKPIKEKETVTGGTLTLEQAYDRALATDQSIHIAYWEIRKANLLPWSALAKLGPQISLNGSYDRHDNASRAVVVHGGTTTVNGITTTVPTTSFDETVHARGGAAEGSVTYVQPLVDLTVFPAYHLGTLTKVAARLEHQFTIRETLFGLVGAFYEVLKQQRLVEVDTETLRLTNEQLDLAQKRANVGEVTRADVLRATVTVEQARQQLVQDQGALDIDRNTLANILNFAPDTPFTVIEPQDYPGNLPVFTDLLSRAYSHREDLKVADIAVDQDIARRNAIIGEYGPRVVAQFDGSAGHNSGFTNNSTHDWDALVSVQVPIFTGGQREVDLLTANRQIEETKLNRDKTAKTVETDVKNAWVTVRTLQQTLKALHAQVVAAEQGYHDLENQYRAGTATSVDVLTALNDLNSARKDLAVQTYGFQVALRNLEQTTGIFQEARVQRSKIP